MTVVRYEPWGLLNRLRRELDETIDNTARDSASHRLATFAIPLQAAGYRTGFIGKWHMGNDDARRPGWTRWVAMKGQGEAVDPKLNVDGARSTVKPRGRGATRGPPTTTATWRACSPPPETRSPCWSACGRSRGSTPRTRRPRRG